MKKITIALALCAVFSLTAAEQVLYKSDFKNDKSLTGWFDVKNGYTSGVPQKKPTKALTLSKVMEVKGETFLKGGANFMGITHPFAKPILVDDNLKSITLKMVMRQTPKSTYSLIEMAFTSRLQPAATNGGPFWRGRDSGIAARGYSYPIQAPNFIYWRKDGGDNKKFRSTKPYNLVPKKILTQWVTCVLTYNHEKKMVTFDCDDMQTLVYHNVDLKGVELKSFFINQNSNEYKSIEVFCVTK